MSDEKISEAMEQRLEGKIDAAADRLATQLGEKIRESETKLLSAFHSWSRSMEIRVRSANSNVANFDERLALAEERISELERHKGS
jgi:chemotaxis protein CheY-P-specific phosphatase CheC